MTMGVSMGGEEKVWKTHILFSMLLLTSLLLTLYWSELVTWSILVTKESGKYSLPVFLGRDKWRRSCECIVLFFLPIFFQSFLYFYILPWKEKILWTLLHQRAWLCASPHRQLINVVLAVLLLSPQLQKVCFLWEDGGLSILALCPEALFIWSSVVNSL